MAEHSDLITEMPFLEKMNTEERLKLARKRRAQQLKRWSQREKEYYDNHSSLQPLQAKSNGRKKSTSTTISYGSEYDDRKRKIHFVSSVMVLEAATRNDIDEVRRLLMNGVDPDSTNEDGLTALHQCCIDNCEEMMKLLLEFGANVNAKDSEQWTPLHAAATCGHLHLIKILIDKGADLLAVNADGNMPYDICEDEQTLDYIESEMAKRGITQELIDTTRAMTEMQMLADLQQVLAQGGDLNRKDEQGATPLHIAAANGYMSIVEFLIENNANLDEKDNDQWQPIHAAACWGYIDVIECLVANGADLDAKTKNSETPFDICEDPDLRTRILQLKSEMDAKKLVSTNRLRRSHSQNTRTHSIRRTSIREKSQIAKREAIEEARIWHEQQSTKQHNQSIPNHQQQHQPLISTQLDSDLEPYESKTESESDCSPVELNHIDLSMDESDMIDSVKPNTTSSYVSPSNGGILTTTSTANAKNSILLGTNVPNASVGGGGGLGARVTRMTTDGYSMTSYHHDQSNPNNPSSNTITNNTPNGDSVKVEIHVTVNANNSSANGSGGGNGNNGGSTLIDLKKQRIEKHRGSLPYEQSNYNNSTSHQQQVQLPPQPQLPSLPPPTSSSSSSLSYRSASIPIDHPNLHLQIQPPPPSQSSQLPPSQNVKKMAPQPKIITTVPSTANYMFEHPSSPSTVKKRFRGNPGEVIGESSEKNGCCSIC